MEGKEDILAALRATKTDLKADIKERHSDLVKKIEDIQKELKEGHARFAAHNERLNGFGRTIARQESELQGLIQTERKQAFTNGRLAVLSGVAIAVITAILVSFAKH